MANDKWSGSNPWLGLAPYTEGTPLYGRTKESIQLADIIKDNMASVVFGKSGIGKSSLLSAGISPLLREENYIPVRIRLVHNTEVSYIEQIESKVRETVNCIDRLPTDVNNLGLWDFFHRHLFMTEDGSNCIPVIILDQFEEIYTLTDADHKKEIITFFNELSSLLNDVKPDNVIEEERKHSAIQNGSDSATPKRGIIKRSAASALNYTSATTFRFVICLREDKLYLLERNSTNIPSLKANRYNLQALSPESALEVIMCPRPELFSNDEATAIVDKLADMGDEGIRTVDPAILSLLLYRYYEKQGEVKKRDILLDYYKEATSSIRTKSMIYLEGHIASPSGIRYQQPLDSVLTNGVNTKEVDLLVDKKILRKDVHGNIVYIEFLHDRIAIEAAHCLVRRKAKRFKHRIILGISLIISTLLCIIGIMFIIVENQIEINNALREQIEVTHDNFGISLSPDLTERQLETIDEILSSMVPLNDNLLISIFELTNSQWYGIKNDKNGTFNDIPITGVTYGEVLLYIMNLSDITNIQFDLPTVEEWEFAARGGEKHLYSGSNNVDEVAWYRSNSEGMPHKSNGQKNPNAFGLFDMSGNVWEMCFTPDITDIENSSFYACGGSYRSIAKNVEVSSRKSISVDDPRNDVGFRLVIRLDKTSEEVRDRLKKRYKSEVK